MTILKIKVWLSPLKTFKYEGKIIPGLISNIEKPRAFRQSGMKWHYHLFHEPLVIPISLCTSSTLSTSRLSCCLVVSPASQPPLPSDTSRFLWSQHSNCSSLHTGVRSSWLMCRCVELGSRAFPWCSVRCCGALRLTARWGWAPASHRKPCSHGPVLSLLSSLPPFVLALIFVFKSSASTLFFWWHSVTLRTWKSRFC